MLGSRVFKVCGFLLLLANIGFVALLMDGSGSDPSGWWDFWGMNLAMVVPILACFARAILGGPRRAGAAWLGAAMIFYAAGNVIFLEWTQYQAHPPVPSPADISYLLVYPCVAAALFCLLRGEHWTVGKGLWLDGALGAAGAATALSAILSPALSTAGDVGPVVVSAAFTVGDLLLIAMVFGVLAVRGVQGGSMWLWLGAGLATFCAADVAYSLQVASGTFVVGTLWGSLWVIGLTVAAFALWRPQRPLGLQSRRSTAMLAIPTLATVAAVVTLIVSSVNQLPHVVTALATFTLVLAAVRTFVAFGQVQLLSGAYRQAVTDDLTGLGNRRSLFEHGAERLEQVGPADRVALILIDLNDFKEVNDSLGHHAGDQLLCEVARRLAARVSYPDFIARLGGDEFALVLELKPGEDGKWCAERILDRIGRDRVLIEGARVRVDASGGVAEGLGSESGIAELLRRADVAMYAAKAGGTRVELYDPELDEENRTRLVMIHDLEVAIADKQFVLHYQPKIDTADGSIVGAEALVRWQHPTKGLLYPDAFLPLVEQSHLMGPITRLVFEAAVDQIVAWRAIGLEVRVAVNISASDLLDGGLADHILELTSARAVPVSALEIEITESVIMADPKRAQEVLEDLRGLGLRIAVDDYGTGYSALAYLRDLPIDELKIDKSFTASMDGDPRSAAIVRSTIELAHSLGFEVVAEGVEHQHVLDDLKGFGCDLAQGYHFSRPVPAANFAALVVRARDERPPAAPPLIAV